jgi:hypothetical protein
MHATITAHNSQTTPIPNGQAFAGSTVRRETMAELLHGSGSAARRAAEPIQTRTRTPLMRMISLAVVIAFLAVVNEANAMCIDETIASCSIGGQAGTKECIGGHWGPCEIPAAPPEPGGDPDRDCTGATKTFTLDDGALAFALRLLEGTRIQISHTRQGVPIVGEPRTIKWTPIPLHKLEELEQAQQARCAHTSDPDACMREWEQQLNETMKVYTSTPTYNSYIQWGPQLQLAGHDYEPLDIPVIEKGVSGTVAKVVWTLLGLGPFFSIDRAKCYINEIGATVATDSDFAMYMDNGYLALHIPLDSGFSPTLKCEGKGVALYGAYSYGWADDWFPDVDLDDISLTIRLGLFKNVDGLPLYAGAFADFHADLDINNTPGFVEDVIDWFKDYRDRVKNAVQEKMSKRLQEASIKEKFGKALLGLIGVSTGDSVERICNVDTSATAIRFEYEVGGPTLTPKPLQLLPVK